MNFRVLALKMELNGYVPSNSPVFFVEESDNEDEEIGNIQNSIEISSFCEAYCTDPRYILGLQNETQDSIVAESPPYQSNSTNETSSKIQYLPGLLPASSNSSQTFSASFKRPIKPTSRGRGRPQKFIKLEGVTSKLNGKVYQVYLLFSFILTTQNFYYHQYIFMS